MPLELLHEPRPSGGRRLEYVAPEAVRAPSKDIRSAIYSLGCTFVYMVTGKAPAGQPDMAGLSAKVPQPLLAVVQKMLARTAKARQPAPVNLLRDLGVADADASLRVKQTARRGGATLGFAHLSPGVKALLCVPVLALVALGVVLAVMLNQQTKPSAVAADDDKNKPTDEKKDKPAEGDGRVSPKREDQGVRALFEGLDRLNLREIRREVMASWGTPLVIPEDDALRLNVNRLASLVAGKDTGKDFPSLAAACAAAAKAKAKTVIIDLYDNGPFHEPPITLVNVNLVVRPAKGEGYRPLIVWHPGKAAAAAEKGAAVPLLSLTGGDLTLVNLDLAVNWTKKDLGPAQMVRVEKGNLHCEDCTFSVAGQHPAGVTAIRFEGTEHEPKRCGLIRCYLRGTNLTALDAHAPGADVMVERSLLIGRDQPLLRLLGDPAGTKDTVYRVVRSTLVGKDVLFKVTGTGDHKEAPILRWKGWDALLVHQGKEVGGTMVELPAGAKDTQLRWRAANCLYAGWETLVSGAQPLSAADEAGWHKRWKFVEDKALPVPTKEFLDADLARLPAWELNPEPTAYAFAATFTPGLLGCDLPQIYNKNRFVGVGRPNWVELAYRGFKVPEVTVLRDSTPPEIPKGPEGFYFGGRVDLNKTDLGTHLREINKTQKFGPDVVLYLSGSGVRKMGSVFPLQNVNLYLYFEPPGPGDAPLVLEPSDEPEPDQTAVLQLEKGNLNIIGGEIRCPEGRDKRLPPYLIHVKGDVVKGGGLFLHGTKLVGPWKEPPPTYRGLIRLDGSGSLVDMKAQSFTIHDSVLMTARVGIHLVGIGARLRLEQSVLAARGDALVFGPWPIEPMLEADFRGLNVQCTLEKVTVAAGRSAVVVGDLPVNVAELPLWARWDDPVILQTKACAFLAPFAIGKGKSSLLAYYNLAMERGMLAWQSEQDVFDSRWPAFVAQLNADGSLIQPEKRQAFTVWEQLWGPLGRRQALTDIELVETLTLDRPRLNVLQIPPGDLPKGEQRGANLERLKIVK
jgi:hypothetical protein